DRQTAADKATGAPSTGKQLHEIAYPPEKKPEGLLWKTRPGTKDPPDKELMDRGYVGKETTDKNGKVLRTKMFEPTAPRATGKPVEAQSEKVAVQTGSGKTAEGEVTVQKRANHFTVKPGEQVPTEESLRKMNYPGWEKVDAKGNVVERKTFEEPKPTGTTTLGMFPGQQMYEQVKDLISGKVTAPLKEALSHVAPRLNVAARMMNEQLVKVTSQPADRVRLVEQAMRLPKALASTWSADESMVFTNNIEKLQPQRDAN